MKKRYGHPVIVSNSLKEDFTKELDREIDILQFSGYEVEVQYSSHYINTYHSCTKYTALLLPYKEENS